MLEVKVKCNRCRKEYEFTKANHGKNIDDAVPSGWAWVMGTQNMWKGGDTEGQNLLCPECLDGYRLFESDRQGYWGPFGSELSRRIRNIHEKGLQMFMGGATIDDVKEFFNVVPDVNPEEDSG